MKANRITITGDFRSDDTVNFTAIETIFTGEGALDYINKTIEQGVTVEAFEEDEEAESYFENKYSKEGFDFYCSLD